MCPPGLPLPHETSSALASDGGCPGSVDQNDEDVSKLIPVLLAHGKELNLKDPRWQTKEGKHLGRVQEEKGVTGPGHGSAGAYFTGEITLVSIECARPYFEATSDSRCKMSVHSAGNQRP